MLPLALLLVAILFSVTGELLLKHGMNRFGVLDLHPTYLASSLAQVFSSPYVLAGFACIFTGSIFWLSVISRVHLSYAYPMLSLSYILVVGASWLFLGEQFTWVRVLGVLVIILGVSLVFWSGQ
ncbi:MAG: EamA family transporter [Chloroflexi bacterium]|nr:EamA family transporter [Chloroflexota bacterium]